MKKKTIQINFGGYVLVVFVLSCSGGGSKKSGINGEKDICRNKKHCLFSVAACSLLRMEWKGNV